MREKKKSILNFQRLHFFFSPNFENFFKFENDVFKTSHILERTSVALRIQLK